MKFCKFLTLFFFIFPSFAFADLAITDWKENIELTKNGKNVQIMLQGKITDLPANYYQTSFSFIFDKKQNIKITKVISDNKPADHSFIGNSLNIKFSQHKRNHDFVAIYFSYEETYDKIHEFLRQETIYIPEFAAGANAKVNINFSWDMEPATLNRNLTKSGNSFVYNNIVPPQGVREIIKLTSSRNIWDVTIKDTISSDSTLDNIEVTSPIYFQNAGQRVEAMTVQSSVNPIHKSSTNENTVFKFADNIMNKNIVIENKARIATGKYHRTNIVRNPFDYTKFSQAELTLLAPIVERIKQDERFKDLPLYAKIGKFVNEYIKYDINYVGRLPKFNEILQNPIGVCTEYATLYDALARVAGIPSLIVNGAAYGEYDKFEGHAWNLIHYNNQWIFVDPTWDLMSGIVSASHIYFNDNNKEGMNVKYRGNKENLDSKRDFEIKRAF